MKAQLNEDIIHKQWVDARRTEINRVTNNLIKYMKYVSVNNDGILCYNSGFWEALDEYLKTIGMCQSTLSDTHYQNLLQSLSKEKR